MSSDRPIFVVGCPRSGTTMLSLMIHAHPRMAMPPESRFLLRSWRNRKKFGDLSSPEQRMALAKACVRTGSKVRDLGLDPQEVLEAILVAPPTYGSAYGTIFKMFADKHGKARWGDKRPAYYQEVDLLLRLFPDAQIVHIVRDGRANVASLKKMPWWPYDSIGSMAAWSQAEYCSRRNAKRLPADVFHVVRYESLVANPEPVLRDLCRFLEEDFHPSMLEPSEVRDIVPEKKVWHGNLKQSVNTDRVESWRKGLEPWELGLMETVLRRKLKRWDYPLSGAGERPSPKLVAKYAKDAFERRSAMRKRWAEESREAAAGTYPLAAQLTSRQLELAATSKAS
ncbi:MAG TPA: sulfotransferase [Actinomycetes bacterium]